MPPSTKSAAQFTALCLGLLSMLTGLVPSARAQQIQVNAANPASAAQGTVSLDVTVTGKGFKNGARAKFQVTGTNDPGGVQVNSTTFVSSTEVVANVTVSDTSVVANFDIQVQNTDGRTGKGTELFAVVAKGHASCPTPAPAPILGNCYLLGPGCLDTSFGTSGLVATQPPGSTSNSAEAVLVQDDGRIVIAGMTFNPASGTGQDFLVARYNTDGSPDKSFGDPDPSNPGFRLGHVITSFVTGDQFGHARLQPDGKIVVAGYTNVPVGRKSSRTVMAVARYNADGTLDPGFGGVGKVTVDFGTNSSAWAIAFQSDGKIVLAGIPYFSLARLNPDGSLDGSFGTGGIVTTDASGVSGGTSSASQGAVAIQRIPAVTGEERIVVGGWAKRDTTTSSHADFALMRFRPDGAIDSTFGNNGRVSTDFFGFGDQVYDLTLDSANRVIAAGFAYIGDAACGFYVKDFGLARYLEDGSLDPSFNGTGRQTAGLYEEDTGRGVAVQADGKIVTVGFARGDGGEIADFGVVRFNPDGSRDASFGLRGDGVVGTDFNGDRDYAYAVGLQSDGKIVVAGTVYVNDVSGLGLARFRP